MIQLKTTPILGADDTRDGSLASMGKKFAADFHNALSGALSASLKDSRVDPNNLALPLAPAASTVPAYNPFSIGSASTNPIVSTMPVVPVPPTDPGGSSAGSTPSFDDAYWAAQPLAVQALRNVDDYDQRTQMAAQLTAQGYNIDVPIMVYGWDPAKITAARESYGYTWVPSAMQNAIPEAPGVAAPGIQAYDAKNPPAGSIAV